MDSHRKMIYLRACLLAPDVISKYGNSNVTLFYPQHLWSDWNMQRHYIQDHFLRNTLKVAKAPKIAIKSTPPMRYPVEMIPD